MDIIIILILYCTKVLGWSENVTLRIGGTDLVILSEWDTFIDYIIIGVGPEDMSGDGNLLGKSCAACPASSDLSNDIRELNRFNELHARCE